MISAFHTNAARATLVLLTAGLLAAGCVNEPTTVGSGLVPGGDLLKADSLTITASGSRSVLVPADTVNSFRTTVVVGARGTLEAWGLILFIEVNSGYSTINIQSAEIHLTPRFHLGDSLASVSFDLRRARADWTGGTFDYDDVRDPSFTENPPRSSHNLGTINDTLDVVLPLDTALVGAWVRSDTATPNFGVVLEPTNADVLYGFVNPRLLILHLPDGATDPDTLTFQAILDQYGFVLGGLNTSNFQDSVLLTIRAGAAVRSIISFNVSALPAYSAIHRAILEISADESQFDRSSNMRDSLMATFRDQTTGFIERFEALSTVSGSGSSRVYSFNVTPFVQFWTQGAGLPEVGIRAWNERNGIEGFVLHGSAALDSLKPRLKILYSRTRQ